jgi:hypothetical protein
VDKQNAILNLRPDQEAIFAADADHFSICRFADPESSGFEIVSGSIAEMCTKALNRTRNGNTPAVHSGE